jgi:hypothetical protein
VGLPVLSALGGPVARPGRQASREVAVIRASATVAAAREAAKVEAVAQVTETALIAAGRVSAVEALLVAHCPHAEARLRHIADAGVAGMANVVLGMERRL